MCIYIHIIYIYIVRPSAVRLSRRVPPSPSSCSVRPSVRAVFRPAVVIRPLSVRASLSVPSSSSVLCPSAPSSVEVLLT